MPKLSKTVSHSAKESRADETKDEQHGRRPSSLHAERATAALRQPGNESAITPSDTPDPIDDHMNSAPGSLLHPPLTRRTSAYAPQKPSPLNPTISLAPNNDERRSSNGSGSSSEGKDPIANPPRRLRPAPRPPISRPRSRGFGERGENEPRRVGTPTTIAQLGSDYTRYFNPFSDSRRNSFGGTSTPLPRYNVSSGASTPLLNPNPFATPNGSTTKLNASTPKLNAEVDEKDPSLVDDRLVAPYSEKGYWSWPLIDDQPEADDDMHMPSPDDDAKFKPKLKDHFRRENIVTTVGFILFFAGLLFTFIILPVLSLYGIIDYNSTWYTPLDQIWKPYPEAEAWAVVNNKTYSLLRNIRTGLIDPTTPQAALTKKGMNGDDMVLVFSDEFNKNNRTFYEGDDPYWFAPDIWYGATKDLDWYDPDAVTTWDGTLELRLDQFPNHGINFRSGMLNSWNHLCFKGGIFEVSVSLPGPAAVMGLWPGAWTMGNLGRPGYLSTTDGLWPYTYNSCDVGITPNQSSHDGLSLLPGQRLPSCTCPSEDHPTPGTGRGAPEIDIFEAGASYGGLPIVTQSYQVAPFDIWWYPDYNFTAFPDYSISYPNGYTGGPYQQAISATTNLNKQWYDGKAYQKYHFEYVPGVGEEAYIAWFVGDQMTFMMDGRSIGPNGNIAARQISQEPMSIILNLGISNAWTWIDWEHLVFPAVMRIDYVRWYQNKGEELVTCDPPGYETTRYIKEHINAYTNPNFTHWDETGHKWPKHKLNSDC
ncbi:beta-glucan synthesis-associated [Delitschia confertaspora ATCC 74209]|uniref:Beta-glucan synthesis-associated n=1 Tax=Delitschia confertaspora ATCC 74209 TaxID=1513339 RepID=A0A9P4JCD1_9PLEO|nr:beta-glucan synthesis-associated [Delitschia confertaspora ATCC 74209]